MADQSMHEGGARNQRGRRDGEEFRTNPGGRGGSVNRPTHPIRCTCGALQGEVERTRQVNRGVCYCADCQAFAHFLGRAHEILDAQGGTEVIQIAPRRVTMTRGREHLACMRLSPNGLLRWYAACCNTPLGNTLPSYRLSFVGLVHTCLRSVPGFSLDDSFGPVRMRANTSSAKGNPRPATTGLVAGVMRILAMMLQARLGGGYRCTPFFDAATGEPVAPPRVLSETELTNVRAAVRRS